MSDRDQGLADYCLALAYLREMLHSPEQPRLDVECALAHVLTLRSRRAQDILPARMEELATSLRSEANTLDAVWGPTLPMCVRLRVQADEAMELARMVRAGVEP